MDPDIFAWSFASFASPSDDPDDDPFSLHYKVPNVRPFPSLSQSSQESTGLCRSSSKDSIASLLSTASTFTEENDRSPKSPKHTPPSSKSTPPSSPPLHPQTQHRNQNLLHHGEYGYVFRQTEKDGTTIAIKQGKITSRTLAPEYLALFHSILEPSIYTSVKSFKMKMPDEATTLTAKKLEQGLDLVTFDFLNEAFILSNLSHPRIAALASPQLHPIQIPRIHVQDTHLNFSPYRVPMDCYNWTLDAIINRHVACSTWDRKRFLFQFLQALHYVHLNQVVHADLKPSNVLLSGYKDVFLGDFGLSKILTQGTPQKIMPQSVYSLHYRPIELLAGGTTLDASCDMWAFGCIAADLIVSDPALEEIASFGNSNSKPRTHPLKHFEMYDEQKDRDNAALNTVHNQLKRIVQCLGVPDKPLQGDPALKLDAYAPSAAPPPAFKALFPKGTPDEAIDLLQRLWRLHGSERYTAMQCMLHPYFHEFRSQIDTDLNRSYKGATWCKPVLPLTYPTADVKDAFESKFKLHRVDESLLRVKRMCLSLESGTSATPFAWKLTKRIFLSYVYHTNFKDIETLRGVIEDTSIYLAFKMCYSTIVEDLKHYAQVVSFQYTLLTSLQWRLNVETSVFAG